MADIRESLVLEDVFSQVFDRYISQTTAAADALQNMQATVDRMSGSYDLSQQSVNVAAEAVIAFSESSEAASRSVEENMALVEESFHSTAEAIFVMNESVLESTVAIDQWSTGLQRADQMTLRSGRSMQRFGMQTGKMLGSLTGVPPVMTKTISLIGSLPGALSSAQTGLGGMTAGFGAATAGATGLMAALGPMTIAVSVAFAAVSGIAQLVQNNAAAAQKEIDDLTDKITVCASQNQAVLDEMSGLRGSLKENIGLIQDLNAIGADNSFISRLQQENEEIEQQIRLNALLYDKSARERSQAVYELASGSNYSYEINVEYEDFYGNIQSYVAPHVNQSLEDTLQGILNEFNQGNLLEEMIGPWTELVELAKGYANELYDAVPGHAELSSTLDSLVRSSQDALWVLNDMDNFDLARITDSTAEAARNYIESLEPMDAHIKAFFEEQERLAAEAQKAFELAYAKNTASLNQFKTSVIDISKELSSLTNAHAALTEAIDIMNAGQDISVQTFYDLMSISPEYLNLLMMESAGVFDLDEATRMLTQARINEMGVAKAREMLSLAAAFQEEQGTILGYAGAIDIATDSVWGLVEEQLRLIEAFEATHLVEQGYSADTAALMASQRMEYYGITGSVNSIRDWTNSAGASALERPEQNMRIGEVGRVGSVGRVDREVSLADEDLKMLMDAAERQYVIEMNNKTLAPEISVQVTNANGDPLDENDIANAIKNILEEQIAVHTDNVYN